MRLLNSAQDFQAAQVRHHDVEDHDIVGIVLDFAQRLVAIVRRLDLVAVAVKDTHTAPDDDVLVVYDQNSRAH